MPTPTLCTVTGNVKNLLGSNVQNCTVRASIITPFFHSGSFISGELETTQTSSSGDFSLSVIETYTVGQKVSFTFEYYDGVASRRQKSFTVVVPNQGTAALSDLLNVTTFPAVTASLPATNITVSAITGITATDAQAALAAIEAQVLVNAASITSGASNFTAHTADQAAHGAVSTNTVSKIVARDASGNFAAGTITAAITGNVTGNLTGNVTGDLTGNVTGNVTGNTSGTSATFTGSLTGDVTSTGMATTVATVGAKTAAAIGTSVADTIAATNLNTVGTLVKRDGSGNFSAGTVTANLTGNVTGNVTGTAANVTGTVAIANGGTGQTAKAAAFDALSPTTTKGDIAVYSTTNTRLAAGSDGQVLVGDSTQALGVKWSTLNQGSKNYITYGTFENSSATGWHTFNATTAAGGLPSAAPTISATNAVDAATAASITTFGTTTTGKLAGTTSFQVASSGAFTRGQGFSSDALTIDTEDQAKVLSFKFYYSVTANPTNGNFSGTTSNSFAAAIYDVTNAAWIQPAGSFSMVQSSGVGVAQGSFQTSSNGTQYRIVVYCMNATAGAITMLFDDFSLSPQSLAFGPPITDVTTTTGTYTGFGTVGTNQLEYWRVGDVLKLRAKVVSGTMTGVEARLALPNGLVSADTTKIPAIKQAGSGSKGNTTADQVTVLMEPSVAYVTFGIQSASLAGLTKIVGTSLLGTAQTLAFDAEVPIAGWSSNTAMSADSDTRQVIFYGAAQNPGTFGSVMNVTTDTDTHGSYSAGTYTVPVAGKYKVFVKAELLITSGNCVLTIYKNGSTVIGRTYAALAGSMAPVAMVETNFVAGDTISAKVVTGSGTQAYGSLNALDNIIVIERASGPATIAASESVNARYSTAAGQSIANGAYAVVDFGTKTYDSHGAVTTGAGVWKFTAPRSGKYSVKAALVYVATAAAIGNLQTALFKGGTLVSLVTNPKGSTSSFESGATLADTISLLAGEYIQIETYQSSGGALALNANATECFVAIDSVGN